jgi:serine/threonine protein kinase
MVNREQVQRRGSCQNYGSHLSGSQSHTLRQHHPQGHQTRYSPNYSDNILLPTENGLSDLKIADFGLSTKLDFFYPKTATSKCGTMLYMAPEILCNFTYTKSVDVWSSAIIMYMLLHGKHPLHEPRMSNEDYKRKIKSIKFAPLSDKYSIVDAGSPRTSSPGYLK